MAGILLCIFLVFLRSVSGITRTSCQSQVDCTVNEYCETRYSHTCLCKSGYVSVPGEQNTCFPEQSRGEPCIVDAQCSHLGLSCFQSRCDCPNGVQHSNGVCVSVIESGSLIEPTPPAHLKAYWESSNKADLGSKTKSGHPSERGGYAGPIAVCALIVVAFSILIITSAYNFRNRNRRLEEVRAILDTHAAAAVAAVAPNVRRSASLGSLRDAPPSYNTISPPSYEQATAQSTSTESSPSRVVSPLRRPSYSHSTETAPISLSDLSFEQRSVRYTVSPTDPLTDHSPDGTGPEPTSSQEEDKKTPESDKNSDTVERY